jgi:hypothetical protein
MDNDIPDSITREHILSLVKSVQYHQFPGTRLTACCITLANGFSVLGTSSSVSDENFDAEIGRQIAYQDALDKVWPLEGYLLRQRIATQLLRGRVFALSRTAPEQPQEHKA